MQWLFPTMISGVLWISSLTVCPLSPWGLQRPNRRWVVQRHQFALGLFDWFITVEPQTHRLFVREQMNVKHGSCQSVKNKLLCHVICNITILIYTTHLSSLHQPLILETVDNLWQSNSGNIRSDSCNSKGGSKCAYHSNTRIGANLYVANKLTLKNSAYPCFTNQHFTLHSSHPLATGKEVIPSISRILVWQLSRVILGKVDVKLRNHLEGSYDKNAPRPKPHTLGDMCRISTFGYL